MSCAGEGRRARTAERVKFERETHLGTTDYLRPHDGAGRFRAAARVPAGDGTLPEVSNDMRQLIEEEWPELVNKLPPKVPIRR